VSEYMEGVTSQSSMPEFLRTHITCFLLPHLCVTPRGIIDPSSNSYVSANVTHSLMKSGKDDIRFFPL
jgi:hypothetical protein